MAYALGLSSTGSKAGFRWQITSYILQPSGMHTSLHVGKGLLCLGVWSIDGMVCHKTSTFIEEHRVQFHKAVIVKQKI